MQELPETVEAYSRTATFSERSVPAKLLAAHRTKAGTWGKIVVLEGRLSYRILEPDEEVVVLSADVHGVVEPQVPHQVEPLGEVEFYVEFYR